MTDARFPGHWVTDPLIDELSDQAFRVFVNSLGWSADHGTDGYIPSRSVRLLHPNGVSEVTIGELTRTELWLAAQGGYQVNRWDHSQTAAAQVEWQRARNRAKNAAFRKRQQETPS